MDVRENCAAARENCAVARKFGTGRAKSGSGRFRELCGCSGTLCGCAGKLRGCAGKLCGSAAKLCGSAVARKFGPGRAKIWFRSVAGIARLRGETVRMCGRADVRRNCADVQKNCADLRGNCAAVRKTCAIARKFGTCRAKIRPRSVPGIARLRGRDARLFGKLRGRAEIWYRSR